MSETRLPMIPCFVRCPVRSRGCHISTRDIFSLFMRLVRSLNGDRTCAPQNVIATMKVPYVDDIKKAIYVRT
jgi:hypothetical protein